MTTAKRTAYKVEFFFRSKPSIIYPFLAMPSGLQQWFAEEVSVHGKEYTFTWQGSQERAELVDRKREKFVKFQWIDREGDEYLLMELIPDELTGETILAVTDFENEDEIDDAREMWATAIDQLHHIIGG